MSNRVRHIGIIMDGNGRWATAQGKTRTFGHEKGAETVREITTYCAAQGEIERLSLYAFSTENWKRPKIEIEFLMKLLEKYLQNELPTYLDNNIRFEPIGDMSSFSSSLRHQIEKIQNETSGCTGMIQSLALNYGARDEIIRSVQSLVRNGLEITADSLTGAMDCTMDIDLLIRTGGDHRLSNFMLWQAAYAELFFSETLWPDFNSSELEQIIQQFKQVERRFGGLN